jgi:hypothetical protein
VGLRTSLQENGRNLLPLPLPLPLCRLNHLGSQTEFVKTGVGIT